MLDDTRIRELWQGFDEKHWPDWTGKYRALLEEVRAAPADELVVSKWQEKLWRARAVTTIGPGESVNVAGAYGDKEIAGAIAALRDREWPEAVAERAEAVQVEYDRILGLVHERHSNAAPRARLGRVFAALIPRDVHCVLKHSANQRLIELLLPATAKPKMMASHVLVRARLRSALGNEVDAHELARRAMFCWWLYEQFDQLVRGGSPVAVAAPQDEPAALALSPYHKQTKGLAYPSGGVNTYRTIVRSCLPGVGPDELLAILEEDPGFAKFERRSISAIVSNVKSMGLIETREGMFHATRAGEDLLEDDLPDPLVEAMLDRVFPFAHGIRFLAVEPRTKQELVLHWMSAHSGWKSKYQPSSLFSWAKSLGLVADAGGGRWKLTDYGDAWARRLPTELPKPPSAETNPDDLEMQEAEADDVNIADASGPTPAPTLAVVSLADMEAAFSERAKDLVVDRGQLAALHAAWHCLASKRFVILSGLSGTGKTKMLTTYADVYCERLGVPARSHVEVVAVSPDWRDPSGLLGYLNPLQKEATFVAEPALRLLIAAAANPDKPYFLVLDEMNLAAVERYFAPLLSAMETGRPLRVHDRSTSVDGVPSQIPWPRNLFIGGTVNMDETTHAFSDKVLDRAFTLELYDVDLEVFFGTLPPAARDEATERVLLRAYAALRPVRRHFGYRTAGEVLRYVNASGEDPAVRSAMRDQAVFSKILPRIRGERTAPLKRALDELRELCVGAELERSGRKVKQMTEALEERDITQFWA